MSRYDHADGCTGCDGCIALGAAQEREATVRWLEAELRGFQENGRTTDAMCVSNLLTIARARGEAPKTIACRLGCGQAVPMFEAHVCAPKALSKTQQKALAIQRAEAPKCKRCCDKREVQLQRGFVPPTQPCPDCASKPDALMERKGSFVRVTAFTTKPDARELALTKERDDARAQCAEEQRAANDAELLCELALKALELAPDVRCAYCMDTGGGWPQTACEQTPSCLDWQQILYEAIAALKSFK